MPAERDSPRILIITGEASGDRYGGLLAAALRRRIPGARIAGIGGRVMREAGVSLIYDADRIAVTGIVEVAASFGAILAAWRAAKARLRAEPPRLVVLVDYPDFNLRFARVARRAGVPVAYFVGPQVWAWRGYRVRRIARDVTRMLVILPFEEAFYRDRGVAATYVGHPLVDLARRTTPRPAAAAALGLDRERPVLGMLPGSRLNEVRSLLPVMLAAAALLRERQPGLQLVLPAVHGLPREVFDAAISRSSLQVKVVEDDFHGAVAACHAALVASGTATLEAALLGVPPVITYRISPWSYFLVRRLAHLRDVGLPNLVLERRAFPECVQDDCRADRLAAAAAPLLSDTRERRAVEAALDEIPGRLGGGGAVDRAASSIVDLLQAPPPPKGGAGRRPH